MPYNRVEKGRGQGLPGNADFRVQDLQEGDTIQWDATINRWVLSRLSGTVVVTTLNDLTDLDIAGATTGSMLYFNGTSWVDLGIGTEDQILTVASGVPTWETPAAAGGSAAITLLKPVDTTDPDPADPDLSGLVVDQDQFYKFTAHFDFSQGITAGTVRPRIAGVRVGTSIASDFQLGSMAIHIIRSDGSTAQDDVDSSATGDLEAALPGVAFQQASAVISGHFQVNSVEDSELEVGLTGSSTTILRAGSWITLERIS